LGRDETSPLSFWAPKQKPGPKPKTRIPRIIKLNQNRTQLIFNSSHLQKYVPFVFDNFQKETSPTLFTRAREKCARIHTHTCSVGYEAPRSYIYPHPRVFLRLLLTVTENQARCRAPRTPETDLVKRDAPLLVPLEDPAGATPAVLAGSQTQGGLRERLRI
jgi:hypothetical protein